MLQWSRSTLTHTAVLMNHAKPGNVRNLGKERNLQRPPKPWEYTIRRHSPHLWKNSSFRICRRKNKQEGKKGILLQILRLHCPQGYWWAVSLFLIMFLEALGGDFSLINALHMMQYKFPYCIPVDGRRCGAAMGRQYWSWHHTFVWSEEQIGNGFGQTVCAKRHRSRVSRRPDSSQSMLQSQARCSTTARIPKQTQLCWYAC